MRATIDPAVGVAVGAAIDAAVDACVGEAASGAVGEAVCDVARAVIVLPWEPQPARKTYSQRCSRGGRNWHRCRNRYGRCR